MFDVNKLLKNQLRGEEVAEREEVTNVATILIVVLPLLPLLVGVLLAWRRKRKYGMVWS